MKIFCATLRDEKWLSKIFFTAKTLKELVEADGIKVNEKNVDGWTALHRAAYHGHTETVKALLDANGINVNETNNAGWTALHLAVRNASADTVKALLAARDINVNEQTKDGWTARDFAWKYNRPEIDELLRKKGGLYNKEACVIQ